MLDHIGYKISLSPDKARKEDTDKKSGIFLTNAILCLKDESMQSTVKKEWFQNCGYFLKKQIEIVKPRVVVTLGQQAYFAVKDAFSLKYKKSLSLKSVLEGTVNGESITDNIQLFAMYHCGARVCNIVRKLEEQKKDWARIENFLKNNNN